METAFQEFAGRSPHWIVRAPGRVNLIGEHTDYNDGYVLPMAIDLYTTIAAAPSDTNVITLRSSAVDEIIRIDLDKPIQPSPNGCWSNYPKGVLAGFIEAGYKLRAFDALIHSTVPLGGGLSSSAALEVATATLLEAIIGESLQPVHKALLCQKAEHKYAGVPCGIMDQFISTLGRQDHLLLLDCRSQEMSWIPFLDSRIAVLIINTNVKHELAASQYPLRRRQCESAAKAMGVPSLREATILELEGSRHRMDPVAFARARHVIDEIDRTLEAARCICNRDWLLVGQLMYMSHESLRRNFEVTCPELDAVVDIAHSIGPDGGVFGCRMTGGGFGGCCVALIEKAASESIVNTLTTKYRMATGIEPTLMTTRPAQGATLIFRSTGASRGAGT